MPLIEGSTAYDLAVRKEKHQQQAGAGDRRPTRHVISTKTIKLNKLSKKKQMKAPLPMVKAFHSLDRRQWEMVTVSGVAFAVLVGFFIGSVSFQMRENELTNTIAVKQQELQALENDYQSMQVTYDTKMSPAAIEEYARNNLGMQKREKFQIEWIEVGDRHDFETDETQESGLMEKFQSYFD